MRTVLWDMDGTIADSEQVHFQAWEMTLKHYGVTYTFDEYIADFGRSNGEILPELLQIKPGAELVHKVSREKEANFRILVREQGMKPLPGVVAWLKRFQAEGVQQVVSSSGPMANIAAQVDILDIGDFFLSLMSGASLPKSKPDPAIFLNSAVAVRAEPHECIVVEDSIHGVDGARRAGMGSIAVGKVARSTKLEQLLRSTHGPRCVAVDSLQEVSWQECEDLWGQSNHS